MSAIPQPPYEGGCRCGRVRIRLSERPLIEQACHCRGCQHMSASAFSTTITVPESALSVTKDETVPGGLHAEGQDHRHCEWCKTWLFTKLGGRFGIVNIRATILDDPSWFTPWMETQTAEKLPWAETGAARSFERFPAPEEFEGLLADYRADRSG